MDTTAGILDADVCYRAILARDRRFDGVFFTAVTTTGIYCRPICPARTPGRDRCRFYTHAAIAERDGFRACFRCRPELAPGSANVDASARLCARVLARLDDDAALAALPAELGVSSRHLRRVVQAELGVRPVALVQSRRLALAKQLVRDTALPMTEVALASGFGSVRRFNSAFSSLFARSPSEFRAAKRAQTGETLSLLLHFRPPYDWRTMLGFLALRAVPGVERVDDDHYLRTVALGTCSGYIAVNPAGPDSVRVTVSTSLLPELPSVVSRVRRLFDLDAHPDRVATALGALPRLRPLVKARPGLRLPGSWSGGEILIRAVLGQQITVVAARTLAGRLVERFGTPVETPIPGLTSLFPRPDQLGSATVLSSLGVLPSRARTLLAAAPFADQLRPGADPVELAARLEAVPGIGPWTAQYILLRALSWPDAWPTGDIVLRQALSALHSDESDLESVRPYRGYAAIHLWTHHAAKPPRKAKR